MSKGNRFSIFSEGAEAEPQDIPAIFESSSSATRARVANKRTASDKKVLPTASKASVPGASAMRPSYTGQMFTAVTQTTPSDTLGLYFVEFDIDGVGKALYSRETRGGRISVISRLGVGAVVALISVMGADKVMQIINAGKPRLSYEAKKRASAGARRLRKGASRFAYYSGKVRSAIARAGVVLKGAPKTLPVWVLSAGTGAIASLSIVKDLSQWFADAVADWQLTFKYQFNSAFKSSDFARLNAILMAGQEARFAKDRNGLAIPLTGRDIKLLAILASTTVMDVPLDIRTSAIIADSLKSIFDTLDKKRSVGNESLESLLARTRIVVYIGSPDDPRATQQDLRKIETEFRQLLTLFSRSIEDITEWDMEDIMVPIFLIANRFVKIPGVLSKLITNSIALGEAAFTKTFDEDTHELVSRIDAINNLNRNDSGFFEYLKNFVLYKLGYPMEGQDPILPDVSAESPLTVQENQGGF